MRHTITTLIAAALFALPLYAQETERDDVRQAYNLARQTGTVEAWDIFLNNYPDSPYFEQARKLRDDAVVKSYCNERTTLDQLVAYIDNNEAHEPRIKTFYANLVNNPTHSYRHENLWLGFAGCTGTVRETVTPARGKAMRNTYEFNAQGLLTRAVITDDRGRTVTHDYDYAYDNLHGYSLKNERSGKNTVRYVPFYDRDDRLSMYTTDDRSRITYTYAESGTLERMVIVHGGVTRTRTYNGGYIIREDVSDGTATRYLYDFDTATGKKLLCGIKRYKGNEVTAEYSIKYRLDTHARITWAQFSHNGKPLRTIERTYTD